jgi:hypothetical protein
MPTTVRRRTWAASPAASPQNVANDRAVKHGRKAPSSAANEAGRVTPGSIGGSPHHEATSAPPMLPHPSHQINEPGNRHLPNTYSPATGSLATITPHTPELRNTSSAAEPEQIPLLLLLLEPIGDC